MKRSPLPKSRKPMKRSRMKPRKRSASEFSRIYGSEERVEWVKARYCSACGHTPSENHHITNGGQGRKADYTKIAPLCTQCHYFLHRQGRRVLEAYYQLDLQQAAARTESAWQSHISNNQESPK